MKKLLSGIILVLSLFSFWSCEKKEKENALEKELIGSWNYELEHHLLYDGQPAQLQDAYNGTMIFYNDNTFEYKLEEPLTSWNTKGTWKVIDSQVYLYFYGILEYSGVYDITHIEGRVELYLTYKRSDLGYRSIKLKLTK